MNSLTRIPANVQAAASLIPRHIFVAWALGAVLFLGHSAIALAQTDFERAPIHYGDASTNNPVAALQSQLDTGEIQLTYEKQQGYLPAVLEFLDIGPSSQVLVNSKTSFQLRRISPRHPRALYFNDKTYIGWVQDGDVLEVMTTDPQQGAMFYTLSQDIDEPPEFVRDQGQCIICHASSRTQGVPGGLVRSVFVSAAGQPHFGSGTFNIDHRSPFKKRWGGWYVSGTHGAMRHMGNVVSENKRKPEQLDREAGANVTDLSSRFDVSPYLTPHSDIVALMVLEHQTQMQNFLTLANYESRFTAHSDSTMNTALDRPPEYVSDATKRRIASAGDKLLRYLLFADEFQLTSPVQGASEFAAEFSRQGPRDSHGRSLRDFDLQTRMFKYPCSYLIYGEAFSGLPKPIRHKVYDLLWQILSGANESRKYRHLTSEDRQAIIEIVRETKPEVADVWLAE
jgi:hypothetical protein